MKSYNIEVSKIKTILIRVLADDKKHAKIMVNDFINSINIDLFQSIDLNSKTKIVVKESKENRKEIVKKWHM